MPTLGYAEIGFAVAESKSPRRPRDKPPCSSIFQGARRGYTKLPSGCGGRMQTVSQRVAVSASPARQKSYLFSLAKDR